MGWIYLAGSADSPLPYRPGCGQSPTVRMTDTVRQYCSLGKRMGVCPTPQSGTTSPHFQVVTLAGAWTSSTVGSRVRTSAWRVTVSGWLESEAAFLLRSFELSKKRNQRLSFWKTCQPLGRAAQNEWGKNWPSAGMIADGRLWPLRKRARVSKANAGFLPRPTAKHYGSNRGGSGGRVGPVRHSPWQLATLGLLPGHPMGALNREYLEQIMGFRSQWTEIAVWVTPWFLSKQGKLSKG
jgi:hypothetical protein